MYDFCFVKNTRILVIELLLQLMRTVEILYKYQFFIQNRVQLLQAKLLEQLRNFIYVNA
jgi:hypothetical protein